MSQPGYWMNEQSGALRPVVEAYLAGKELTPEQITLMRVYLRQWIDHPSWRGADLLRATVGSLRTTADVRAWLEVAERAGIDPL